MSGGPTRRGLFAAALLAPAGVAVASELSTASKWNTEISRWPGYEDQVLAVARRAMTMRLEPDHIDTVLRVGGGHEKKVLTFFFVSATGVRSTIDAEGAR